MHEREHLEYIIQHEYDYTRRILKHYYNILCEEAGIPYDSDCDAEIEGCVDSIQKSVEHQIKLALLDKSENGGK